MINVAEEMKRLHELSKQSPFQIRKPLWKLVTSPEWLAQAWEEIRRNKGSQTAGVDKKTAVDVDISLIHKLSEELGNKSYKPTPVRRVNIPKDNGKTRPLGIPTIKDRIVQQALKMLLEPILETDFRDCSHGFRQGRSTHTALRDVARAYPSTNWIIEGDIEGCFDNIPHGKLLELLRKYVADEKVLSLIRDFLKAGYMEDWQYHQTYSGTPQGGIISPLLANIFLHQLDLFMVGELEANQFQSKKERNSRRNPEYMKMSDQIRHLRDKLRKGLEVEGTLEKIKELERQMKLIPCYDKDKRNPYKVKYVRYADDFVILIAGSKEEAQAIRNKVEQKLSDIGLKLSGEKTKITHWSNTVTFLGYNIQGAMREKGVGIRAILSIPHEKVRKIQDAITQVCGYLHIPEADAIVQINAMYRGWCNYYRFATSPLKTFNTLASFTWWQYAHFSARKEKLSIAAMIRQKVKSKELGEVKKGDRKSNTFQVKVGDRTLILDLFYPKKVQIKAIPNKQNWEVDLKPINILGWQSGRSLATRLEALDRAKGICEKCRENPVTHVHHTVPIRGKTFLARVESDREQRYTAKALCKECHLKVHGGSFAPIEAEVELERRVR